MDGKETTPATGVRAVLTAQERTAVSAYWSSQAIARGVLWGAGSLAILVGGWCLLCGLAGPLTGERQGDIQVVLLLVGILLPAMALVMLGLVRRKATQLADDPRQGEKIIADGMVEGMRCQCSNGWCIYGIGIVIPPRKKPSHFRVPEDVFKALRKGDAVRCAFLPTSMIMLSIEAGAVSYALGDHLGQSTQA